MGLMDTIKNLLAPAKEKASEPTEQPEHDPADGGTDSVSTRDETTEGEQLGHVAAGEPAEATETTDEQPDVPTGEEPVPPTNDEPGSGKDSAS